MIRVLSRLFRVRLAFLNGIAALGGGLLFPVRPGNQVLWAVFAGVTLLAGAGSALNQVLERDLDLLMRRTRRRPLPSGELTVPAAVTIAVVTGGAGCALLTVFGGALPAVLGIAALGWYLAVYTPLKRRTSCALIPGGALWRRAAGNRLVRRGWLAVRLPRRRPGRTHVPLAGAALLAAAAPPHG